MIYQVKLKSPPEREESIRLAVKASKEARPFYEFRGTKTHLPFIRIPVGVPIYRIENFRTYTQQREYVIREKKPLNFFATGQENDSIQQLQHEFLSKSARQGRADSVVPIIEVLKREKQREELLITHRGVVVNGNRRLAGMRDLLAEDEVGHNDFNGVNCIVLPEDTTTAEIVDIEAALQGKPETRLDYDWIGDCQLLLRLTDLGNRPEKIAGKLNRRPQEIRNSLSALTEADLYLQDWKKANGDYSLVEDAEQFFKDIPSCLQGKNSGLEEASRIIAWNLFENREKLDERLYAYNVTFGKQAANVLDRVGSDLGLPQVGDTTGEDDEAGFEVDLDIDAESVSYQPLVDAFQNPDTKDEAVETLIDVCRSILESERAKKSGQAALKAIAAANARLTETDLGRADPLTYAAIEKQLEQIKKRTQVLQDKISMLMKSRDSGEAADSNGKE